MAGLKWHKHRASWKKFNAQKHERARSAPVKSILYRHERTEEAIDLRRAEHVRTLPPEEVVRRLKARTLVVA